MRPEAIQNERDRIGSTRRTQKRTLPPHLSGSPAVAFESTAAGSPVDERNSESDDAASSPSTSAFGHQTSGNAVNGNTTGGSGDASRRLIEALLEIEQRLEATREFHSEAVKSRQQVIHLLINWSNQLHPLFDLPFNDKVLLLKTVTSAFTLLHVLQTSVNNVGHLEMPDGKTKLSISAFYADTAVNTLLQRLIDELLVPLRRTHHSDAEFAALKALLLLNPDLSGLSVMSRDRIRESRDSILRALFGYLNTSHNPADASIRLSGLLMLIPALVTLGESLSNNQTLCPLFGLTDAAVVQTPAPVVSSHSTAEQLLKAFASTKEYQVASGELPNREAAQLLAAQLFYSDIRNQQPHQTAFTSSANSSPPLDNSALSFSSLPMFGSSPQQMPQYSMKAFLS